ncbi:MAG TPA: permease [Polyangiaceae bacterium]|nr:permease [Polyangiaceae bacterium]
MFALALVLSVVGLALGPALVAAGRGRALVTAAVEGLTLGVVPLLVVVRLIPHVMEELGPLALSIVAAGYGGLWLIDRRQHDLGDRVGIAVLIPTLAAHALADGAALGIAFAASREQGAAGMLIALAIVVHRMPEGLLIATRFVPVVGWTRTLLWLGLLAGATLFGALAGDALLEHVPDALFDAVVAVGLGAMLRMVVHAHGPHTRTRGAKAASGLAFLVGAAVALAIPSPENLLDLAQPRELSIASSAGPLFVVTAPAFVLGLVLTGAARAIAPGGAEGSLKLGSRLVQAIRGAALGALAPVAARLAPGAFVGLLDRGAPAAAAVAFALAAASLDLAGAAVSVPLLGAPLAISRFGAAAFVAVALAVLVTQAAGGRRAAGAEAPAIPLDSTQSGSNSMVRARDAVLSALYHSGAWYLGGLILAGALEALLPPEFFADLGVTAGGSGAAGALPAQSPGALAGRALGALLGMLVFIPAYGAAPIGAVLIHKGLSPGAAMAFLIAASGHGHAKASAIRARLGPRASGIFTAGTIVCAASAGTLADILLGGATPDLHALLERDPGSVAWGSAALLGALLLGSVVWFGPREWLSTIARGPRLFDAAAGGGEGHPVDHADHAH